MAIIQISGCVLLLSVVVRARPSVINVETPEKSSDKGSLILHYHDNSTYKIYYSSSTQNCDLNHLPSKKIVKVGVHNAKFVLYTMKNWRGKSVTVKAVGSKEFSPEEILGITKVKSVKQIGCRTRKQKK